MNRSDRRHASLPPMDFIVRADCVAWMRTRRNQPRGFRDSDGRWWQPEWPSYVHVPDIPQWLIGEEPVEPTTATNDTPALSPEAEAEAEIWDRLNALAEQFGRQVA